MGTARTKGAVWAWLVVIGCIGFYSIPTGIIGNTSGIFVAPVMDQFGWTQTDTTMYRTIQPLVAAVCAPIAGKLMEKYNPRWILAAVSAAFGLASWASAYATELWQWNLYGVVYGVTSAFYMYLAAPVLINAWFKKSAGLAISITAATLSILAAVASPIGQELINQASTCSFSWPASSSCAPPSSSRSLRSPRTVRWARAQAPWPCPSSWWAAWCSSWCWARSTTRSA